MPQLSNANIKIIREAVKQGLISGSIPSALYDKSARGQTSMRDLQFILSLDKFLQSKKQGKFKKK